MPPPPLTDPPADVRPSAPAEFLADPATTVVATRLADGAVHVRAEGWPAGLHPGEEPVLVAPGVAAVLVDEQAEGDVAAALGPFTDARGALLDRADSRALLGAVAFGQWRARTRFCPRCAAPLAPAPGGRVLRCANSHQEFPRLEPAVIMRVVDGDDRILLARQAAWPAGRFSVLAGFVDPGETLEETVAREVMEEVGVHVADVDYVSSQPWPFPSSLMLAFGATASTTDLVPQDGEIAEAGWFTRPELIEVMRSGAVTLPSAISVAHRLIQQWMGAEAELRIWGT